MENKMKSSNICAVASQKRKNRDNDGEEIYDYSVAEKLKNT